GADQALEQLPGGPALARLEVILGRLQGALLARRQLARRSQRQRLRGMLSSGDRRSARVRVRRCTLQRARNLLVRPLTSERELPRLLLDVVDDIREPAVKLAPLARRQRG